MRHFDRNRDVEMWTREYCSLINLCSRRDGCGLFQVFYLNDNHPYISRTFHTAALRYTLNRRPPISVAAPYFEVPAAKRDKIKHPCEFQKYPSCRTSHGSKESEETASNKDAEVGLAPLTELRLHKASTINHATLIVINRQKSIPFPRNRPWLIGRRETRARQGRVAHIFQLQRALDSSPKKDLRSASALDTTPTRGGSCVQRGSLRVHPAVS